MKQEFDELTEHDKFCFQVQADTNLDRGPFLHDEVVDLLKRTKGTITFREIASQMKDIVDKDTIRRHMQSLEGFRMWKNRILSFVDESAMKRGLVWGESFWTFWKSVRCLNLTSTIAILCHMDEKCFVAIRTRSNQKVITSEGILPHNFQAQHKSHIGKEMYIARLALD